MGTIVYLKRTDLEDQVCNDFLKETIIWKTVSELYWIR